MTRPILSRRGSLDGGRPGVVLQYALFEEGDLPKSQPVRYWADRGRIHMSWEDGLGREHYDSVSVLTALHRIKALNDCVGNTLQSQRQSHYYYKELLQLERFRDDFMEILKKAKEQGDPMDYKAQKEASRDRGKVMVNVPAPVTDPFEL